MKKFTLRRLGVAHEGSAYTPTLPDCLEAVLGQSDTLVDELLDGLKAVLVNTKSKSIHGSPSELAKLAIESLLSSREELKTSFATALRAAVYGGDTHRNRDKPLVRFDDFQFLDEDQLDANIEFALTQQEVLLAVDDVLPTLNGLVSSLLGWVTVQAALNPLKPEAFVFALRESFQAQIDNEDARAAVITQAAGILGVSLRHLYKELSDWMRSQGIEPVGPVLPIGGGLGAAVKPAENSVTRTMLTLDKLRRLLSGELSPGPQAAGSKDFMHTVPASFVALEDMKMVEPMMKRLVERASQPVPPERPNGMLAGEPKHLRRERTHSKKLGRQLGEEVVRMMLENLMQDRRLMPRVRQSLKALEPVLIKLSQQDARFFSERQHPARQFMDKITSRSLAFPHEDDPGFARFQKALDNSVSVLEGGAGDAAAFTRVLRKLEEGWAKEEHEQRQRAEEAARGLLRAEQRNLLAQKMAEDFGERVRAKNVPEMVTNFLQGPWAQVVAESQLQCVDGAVDSDGYLALVDDLIWSVQLKLARRNRAKLVGMVPAMLVKMRQGLQLISYPEERIPAFFDALITFHEQAFETPKAATVAPQDAAAAEQEPDSDYPVEHDSLWMADNESADAGYMQSPAEVVPESEEPPEVPEGEVQTWTAQSLVTGSWVDLALAGQWVRAQLTWASPHRTLFMFISGSGMAHSMSRRTMDRLRDMGLIRLISDGRVLDNALDAVAQAALRNDSGVTSADD